MLKALVIYVRYIDLMNTWLGKILRLFVFGLIAILLTESIRRYVFDSPTLWSVEMGAYIFTTYFIMGGGYVLLRGGHIRMDIFYSRWSPKTRAIADLATFSLLAVYLVVFIWGGINSAEYSLKFGQHSTTMWGPPPSLPSKLL